MSKNKIIKNVMVHVKYPYTALIIATMWIGIAIIIPCQPNNLEVLIAITSIATLIVACIGFKSPK